MTTLDVGCGSGILSIAARAKSVFACDIEPNAVAVASRLPELELFAGSADAVKDGAADLVLANISTRVVDALAADLNRVTKSNGTIIISGFISGHEPRYFEPREILTDGDWQCWICDPNPLVATERAQVPRHDPRWW